MSALEAFDRAIEAAAKEASTAGATDRDIAIRLLQVGMRRALESGVPPEGLFDIDALASFIAGQERRAWQARRKEAP